MPGPPPKHPSTRARRNKSTTAATISRPAKAKVPPLPELDPILVDGVAIERDWHPMTREWWVDVWSAPMSPEWDASDVHNVYICAAIFDDIWAARTAKDRKEAASEYRLQRKDLGLTPFDRRRLEWTIESADEAKDRGDRRRRATPKPTRATKAAKTSDPRGGLSVVS